MPQSFPSLIKPENPPSVRPSANRPAPNWARVRRGFGCSATHAVMPLGKFVPRCSACRNGEQHLAEGLVLILTGIEGQSYLNIGIVSGLMDAGVPYGLEIYDWTTGWNVLGLYHLRGRKRHALQATLLAERIVTYRQMHPDRPVWIIGHSGGGGLALKVVEALPAHMQISGVILLAAAASPRYQLEPVFAKTERGLWNFYSPADFIMVGLGTWLFGTIDGRHTFSAGCLGFRESADQQDPRLHQVCYSPAMVKDFHLGGHFGWTNRVFVADHLAPIIYPDSPAADQNEKRLKESSL